MELTIHKKLIKFKSCNHHFHYKFRRINIELIRNPNYQVCRNVQRFDRGIYEN